jgi:predicted DNA-binding transcriptional regulator YafY
MSRRRAKAAQAAELEWRLAVRAPIKAYDEYTETTIELAPGQIDPSRIEGLVVDFRYMATDGAMTRRSLLCWQCGRAGDRIYVRGYCPFREEFRTFRIDRMHDLIAFQNGREIEIDSPREFFSAFAADEMDEADEIRRLSAGDD